MVEPQTFGFTVAAQRGPLTKYVKETSEGRLVVYQTDEVAVRVSEAASQPTVAVASSGFFWRDDIKSGRLEENRRVGSVSEAHQQAKAEIQNAIA